MPTITEAQLRQLVANQINQWMGAKKGSAIHKKILATYNNYPAVANTPGSYKMSVSDAWCACTVSADVIILGIEKYTGYEISCSRWITKAKGLNIWTESDKHMPKVGDFVLYAWSDKANFASTDNVDAPNHIGVVSATEGNKFYVVEGNMTSNNPRVGLREMTKNGRYIRGFITPDYANIATLISAGKLAYPIIREDGGYNNGTLTTDQVKKLQSYYKIAPDGYWGPNSKRVSGGKTADEAWTAYQNRNKPSTSTATYTVGSTNEETIYNFIIQVMQLSIAAACGVLANIRQESNFSHTAQGDRGTSYGICQWHNTRFTALKTWCAANGKTYTTLDGQLWYLKHELETNYKTLLTSLRSVSNDGIGAYNAASDWCRIFEMPTNLAAESASRGRVAKETYWVKYGEKPTSTTNFAAKNPYTVPLVTLRQGATGESVKWLQWMLWQLRFGTANTSLEKFVDGVFGPKTATSLKAFQTTYGLAPDGSCGPATRAKLKSL